MISRKTGKSQEVLQARKWPVSTLGFLWLGLVYARSINVAEMQLDMLSIKLCTILGYIGKELKHTNLRVYDEIKQAELHA